MAASEQGGYSEVSGRTVEVTIEGVMSVFARRTEEILADHGIEDVDGEDWYSLPEFLGVLADIEADTGENVVKKIGAATPEVLDWPGDPGDAVAAMQRLNAVYREHHRGVDGGFDVEFTGGRAARVVADNPYPCAFDQGLLRGVVRTFDGETAKVREVGGACRSDGSETCEYEVSW